MAFRPHYFQCGIAIYHQTRIHTLYSLITSTHTHKMCKSISGNETFKQHRQPHKNNHTLLLILKLKIYSQLTCYIFSSVTLARRPKNACVVPKRHTCVCLIIIKNILSISIHCIYSTFNILRLLLYAGRSLAFRCARPTCNNKNAAIHHSIS